MKSTNDRTLLGLVAMLALAVTSCKFPVPEDVPDPDAAIDADQNGTVRRTITVSVDPQLGSGEVVAPPIGINCGSSCSAEVADGTRVTFTTVPAQNAAFVGWRDDARQCGTQPTCELAVDGGPLRIGARFGTMGQAGWVTPLAGSKEDEIYDVASDAEGNVFIAGWFEGELTFQGTTYRTTGGQNDYDLLLAKISPAGDVLWHKVFGGPGEETWGGIEVHRPSGDVVVYGVSFSPAIGLGGSVALTLPTGHVQGRFLARFASDGTWKWQRQIKTTDTLRQSIGRVAVDERGDIFVTGGFEASIDLGDGEWTTNVQEAFVAKIASAGDTILWKKRLNAGGAFISIGPAAVDRFGNLFVGGVFAGPCTVGTRTFTPVAGSWDGLLIGFYGTLGNVSWAQNFGGSGTDSVRGVVTDANANVYVALMYEAVSGETMRFGETPVGSGGAAHEIVVGSFNYSGTTVRWARRFGSAGSDRPTGLALLADGTVGIVGSYNGDITFGSAVLSHAGNGDAFFARLSGIDGTPTFAARASSGAFDWADDIVATSTAVVIGGGFTAQASVFGKTLTPLGAEPDGYAASVIPPRAP